MRRQPVMPEVIADQAAPDTLVRTARLEPRTSRHRQPDPGPGDKAVQVVDRR
jgi:hypothetical protein